MLNAHCCINKNRCDIKAPLGSMSGLPSGTEPPPCIRSHHHLTRGTEDRGTDPELDHWIPTMLPQLETVSLYLPIPSFFL